ncbi:porin [Marinobacterium stanieri]|uniref:Porin n=1 Tax=Marinobacterium stanieri TaxID=49186 RepID=A0A1N6NM29_9GAMM|nr:porin [Marinobacterium stanieri]SIP93208.1 porin [Marinobacterium stanieri]
MQKYIKPSALALGIFMASAASANDALEFSKPDFHMFTSFGALEVENKDFDPEAFELEAGVKGLVSYDSFKMKYEFTVDMAQAANRDDSAADDDEIRVKEAKAFFPTQYGTLLLAPRTTSGTYRNLYDNINIFEYNETHNGRETSTGNPIFNQADEGQDVIAYITPRWHNTFIVAAILAVQEDNDEDAEVKAIRLVHKGEKLNWGLSHIQVDANMHPVATDDYTRMAFTAGYKFDQLHLGATYEINEDTFNSNDFDSYGVAARYSFGKGMSAALGYYDKDADIDAADNSGVVFQVKKELSPNIALWAETGQYDNSDDNIALGVNLKF